MTINTFDRPREAINLLKFFLSFGLEKLRIYPCKKKKKAYNKSTTKFAILRYSNR